MPTSRSYGDPCGIARALDVIGERWALLVVRELSFGPKRFTDLRRGLAGASPNVLSQRLRELESGGVLRRRSAGDYALTDWGRALHPILVELGRWGAQSPARPAGELSVDALLVALEATFVPSRAACLRAIYELRLGEERFSADIEDGVIIVRRGPPRYPDAVISASAETLRRVVFGDLELADAEVEIAGSCPLGRRFFGLFARP